MRSATFRNIALGILALAASYHLGARSATAQQGSTVTGITGGGTEQDATLTVMTANGDVFYRRLNNGPAGNEPLSFIGNFWSGGPTPARQESFGALKSRYRGERGAAQPAPQGR